MTKERGRKRQERKRVSVTSKHESLVNSATDTEDSMQESASLVIRGINTGREEEAVKKKPNKLSDT